MRGRGPGPERSLSGEVTRWRRSVNWIMARRTARADHIEGRLLRGHGKARGVEALLPRSARVVVGGRRSVRARVRRERNGAARPEGAGSVPSAVHGAGLAGARHRGHRETVERAGYPARAI